HFGRAATVFRMDHRAEVRDAGDRGGRVPAHDPVPVFVAMQFVADDVVIPDADAADALRDLQVLFALFQRFQRGAFGRGVARDADDGVDFTVVGKNRGQHVVP